MMKKPLLYLLLILFSLSNNSFAITPLNGSWKFELDTTFGKVPVIIDLNFSKPKFTGIIQNGEEKIKLENLKIIQNKLFIPLQTYEISMELSILNNKHLSGTWIRHNKNPKIILPVNAYHGIKNRFDFKQSSNFADLNGKWKVQITDQDGKKSPGVLVFKQNGQLLNGSLLTDTGDFRYMQGFIIENDFHLASFDGMFNYLFKGKIENNNLEAELLSTYKLSIRGQKDNQAQLSDAYSITKVKGEINFSFPDLSGKMISLKDEKFKNKAIILQFFGSWCPNCLDEMNFLIPWYNTQTKKNIEVIALAFERSLSEDLAKIQLKKVQKKFNIPYPLLIAGLTANDKPEEKIKGLENFASFPTTIFLNKNHQIMKIHSGFTGPGTGEFYEKWIAEFHETVKLLEE